MKVAEKLKACFIGPHPDDIEIGAGGTIKKLSSSWEINIIIVTTHRNKAVATNRKNEAIEAAKVLGVNREHVHFLDMPDGDLSNISVDIIKNILFILIKEIDPHLVFGPAKSDKNEDHIQVYKAINEAARTRGILHYYIPHHIATEHITARVGICIEQYLTAKRDAYFSHQTEVNRGSLSTGRFDELINLGSRIDGKLYELFDTTYPVGYGRLQFEKLICLINDLYFSRLWTHILWLTELDHHIKPTLNMVVPTFSCSGEPVESTFRAILKEKLNNTFPELLVSNIVEREYSKVNKLSKKFSEENTLFGAGPLSNLWVLRFLHGFPGFIFRDDQFIKHVYMASYSPISDKLFEMSVDVENERSKKGALIIMWGWCHKGINRPTTIYAAGSNRYGTAAAYVLLTHPSLKLCEYVENAKKNNSPGVQVNFEISGEINMDSFQNGDTSSIKIITVDYLRHVNLQ